MYINIINLYIWLLFYYLVIWGFSAANSLFYLLVFFLLFFSISTWNISTSVFYWDFRYAESQTERPWQCLRPVLETLFSVLCFWASTLSSTVINELLFLQTETLKSEYRIFLSKMEAASKLTNSWKQEMRWDFEGVCSLYSSVMS